MEKEGKRLVKSGKVWKVFLVGIEYGNRRKWLMKNSRMKTVVVEE